MRASTSSPSSSTDRTTACATIRGGSSSGRRGSEEPHGHRAGPRDEFCVASLRGPAVREEYDRVFPPVTRVAAPEHRPPLLVDREGKARAVELEDHAGGGNPRGVAFHGDERPLHARGKERLLQALGK